MNLLSSPVVCGFLVVKIMEQEKPQVRDLRNGEKGKGIIYGKCPWCNQIKVPLCSHHHPIPKKKGGKKCIRICLNCHFKFHFPKLKKIRIRHKTKKERFLEHLPGVIDLRNTNLKSSEELYELFNGNWNKTLKFLKGKDNEIRQLIINQ